MRSTTGSSNEDKGDDEVSKSNDDDDEENPNDDDDDQDVDDDTMMGMTLFIPSGNDEEEKLDEEKTNEEEEIDETYRDVNINLERSDTEMTNALLSNIQATHVIKDTHVTVVNPEVQQQSSLSSLANLPTFGSLFKFEDRVKTLENDFSAFKQTNSFAEAVLAIPSIVDNHLANQMNEAVKEQVKAQVKEQVSKILLRIEKSVTKQLEAEVLIRSSNEAKTSHVVAANLSELELKKILIDKMENNKSIDISVQQKTLYKALVDAYEADKMTMKNPPLDQTGGKSTEGTKSHQKSTGKFAQADEPVHTADNLEEPAPQEFNIGFTKDQHVEEASQLPDCNSTFNNLARKEDPRKSFNELMDTPLDFSAFVLNRLKVDTLAPELLAGPIFELMKVSIVCDKHALWGISHWGRKRQQFYGYSVNKEFAHDVYSDRLVGIKKLTIVEWHNYKHLEWITVCRDDDKLYTFKEGDYNRLCLQDIEDMLLLLVQGKLTNLNIKERRVEDLQLGIESYHKKLNLTRLDTYRSNLKRKIAYTAYSNPKGFIYQNKDKKNRLMCIDELPKFSDGTLNDVRSTLDDILKRIRMKYLPQTVWRNVDMERAGTMIHAID
ncbi:hypothetical protein Tco_0628880 [Tanacetum coccineum]|uniref:Uncharacterized protein n=1 Tax=Tanacetum coccineum TaxID=301880 RepID=A0ABQ4WRT5_9ASTR